MIISVPVLYRAQIVKPGHRKLEDCLLRAEIGVRLQEASPHVAVRMHDNTDAYGTGVRSRPIPRCSSADIRVVRPQR